MIASAALGQEQVDITVTNIIVPARVLEGREFVDNLNAEDFELFEDGVPQIIQAFYLVRNTDVERKEGAQDFALRTSRNFYLLFQMTDYNPKLAGMIDYLFQQALRAGDALVLQTPMKSYSLSPQALAAKPRKTLAEEMNSLLKKDIKTGNTEYNTLLRDLKRIVSGISGTTTMANLETDSSATSLSGLEFMLNRYKETVRQIEDQRLMDEKKILRFAQALKRVEGQKQVFLIYQREFRPEISPAVLNFLLSNYQENPNIMSDLQDLFHLYTRDLSVNTELLKKAFTDSSINFNFIFMNKEPDYVSGVVMREQSEDVFRSFSKVAQATGGYIDNSQNPAAGFKNAVENASAYYLLCYSPKNYQKDNQFKNITVRVKNPAYTVQHRIGYFAN
ncbi:MAG: VWA domain-containing protein [Candidatus Aminicenantes bacterium]|nr:VWA domain-containing protein [Candidatus Aminicenantes bacterium]